MADVQKKQFQNVMRNIEKYTQKSTWFVLNTSRWCSSVLLFAIERGPYDESLNCFHFYWKGNKWWAIPKLSLSFSTWHFVSFFNFSAFIFICLSPSLSRFVFRWPIIHVHTKSLATSHSSRWSVLNHYIIV